MNQKMKRIMTAAFALAFVISAFMLIREHLRSKREADFNRELAIQMHAAEQLSPPIIETPPAVAVFESETDAAGDETALPAILPKFAELFARNNDLAGWLYIDGAGIDYPVMYTQNEQNHYLHLAFDGSYAAGGTLFLGVPWTENTNHAVIYGHHMNDGSMFGELNRYAKQEFGKDNAILYYDTLYEEREYELVAAFYSKVYPADDTSHFHYYEYHDLSRREDFEYYVEQVKAAALYDTGVLPKWGDSLLTLSTCEYYTKNGRFAIVARLISEK